MTEETLKLLIQNAPAILTAIGVIASAYFSYRANQSSKANAAAIQEVHTLTNGQSEKMGKLAEAVGFGKGEKSARLEGEQKAKDLLHTTDNPLPVAIVTVPAEMVKPEEK